MKSIAFVISLLILASCSKNNNTFIPTDAYSDAKGTWVKVDSAQWYLTRLYNGGELHVKLNGSTNADKIDIRTSGDGVLTDNALPLDANKNFNCDVVNSYSVSSVQTSTFTTATRLIAYKGTDTLIVTINSGPLKY